MSKLMDDAVLNMPFELAMTTPLSQLQYYNRARSVVKEKELLIEVVEQLIACHNEPECPAIVAAQEALAKIKE